jgi:hypothetical protein
MEFFYVGSKIGVDIKLTVGYLYHFGYSCCFIYPLLIMLLIYGE